MMYRDSVLWTLGLLGAVVVALAAVQDLSVIGIPGGWRPYIMLGAFLTGVISAYLKSSPLKKMGE